MAAATWLATRRQIKAVGICGCMRYNTTANNIYIVNIVNAINRYSAALNGNVLDNDGDLVGDPMTAVLDSGPDSGTFIFNNGAFSFTPAGSGIFTFTCFTVNSLKLREILQGEILHWLQNAGLILSQWVF